MLNAEPDRSKRILDLVRDLPRHLSPCEHALCTGHLNPAELEITRQASGRNAAQPEGSESTGCSGEQDQYAEVTATAVEHDVVTARGCAEDVPLLRGSESGTVTEQHFRPVHRRFPCSRELTRAGQSQLHGRRQRAAGGSQRIEHAVTGPSEQAIGVEKEWRLEPTGRAR